MARAHIVIGLCSLLAATALANGLPPFSDYEVILNRKPFGDLTVVKKSSKADKEAEAAIAEENKAKQTLARQIHLVAVNIMPSGSIVVGLVDKTTKPSRSLLLAPGESEAGYKVLEANVEEETAKIEKDDVIITLKLGKGLVDESPKGEEGTDEAVKAPAQEPPTQPAIEKANGPSKHNRLTRPVFRSGYRQMKRDERRLEEQQRRDAEQRLIQAATTAAKKQVSEEFEAREKAREREMSLNLIRQGQPPLSEIELTPEEESDFIDEGILSEQVTQ